MQGLASSLGSPPRAQGGLPRMHGGAAPHMQDGQPSMRRGPALRVQGPSFKEHNGFSPTDRGPSIMRTGGQPRELGTAGAIRRVPTELGPRMCRGPSTHLQGVRPVHAPVPSPVCRGGQPHTCEGLGIGTFELAHACMGATLTRGS